MSENKLLFRKKLMSKLFDNVQNTFDTIQTAQKRLNYLAELDNIILNKKMSKIIQAGGANQVSFKGIESEALITELKLKQQKSVIEKARQTIDTLNNGLEGVRTSLGQLHRLMEDVNKNIDIKPLGDAQLPSLDSYGKQTIFNAFKIIPYDKMVKVVSADDETLYDLINKDQGAFNEVLDINADHGISRNEYNELLRRLHGTSDTDVPPSGSASMPQSAPPNLPVPRSAPGSGSAPAPGSGSAPAPGSGSAPAPGSGSRPASRPASSSQSGGFFSSIFMPKNIENSVTSSEMPFTAQNLYSETSNY